MSLEPLRELLPAMFQRAGVEDQTGDWPSADLSKLAEIGAMAWSIGRAFGGIEMPPLAVHERYELIAKASLATALAISQRDSAAALIEASENETLKHEWLPKLARNDAFATIGIAQLTTSRQGGAPALIARSHPRGWQLNGIVPWSTGADHSDVIVIGAAIEKSDNQILAAIRRDTAGLRIGAPMNLVALNASHTTSIECIDVVVESRDLLRGPMPGVLSGRKKTLPIGQAFLAMGLCAGAIELIKTSTSALAAPTVESFQKQLDDLRGDVLRACEDPPSFASGESAASLRGRCNDLAVRVTHAAVAIFKGSGLVAGHPAQRLAREAMFLLVWSCPAPVVECTLDRLSCV